MGASDKTILSYWHYRTLSEQEIRTGLIEPLKRHHGVLDINVVTGYVDRKTRRVLNPWVQRVVDGIDGKTIHDFASTKRGIDAGVAEKVFEIQSHGWTHMLPDLDSPPGPWWDAPMDGVGSLDWYNEFADRLRDREIPAATQREHLRRSLAAPPRGLRRHAAGGAAGRQRLLPLARQRHGAGRRRHGIRPGYLGLGGVPFARPGVVAGIGHRPVIRGATTGS